MLAWALQAEVAGCLEAGRGEQNEGGHALVMRTGYARPRQIVTGAGTLGVRAPRVNYRRVDESGTRQRFRNSILPPYVHRSPKVSEMLPLLCLHGLSSRGFVPALKEFFGTGLGLSAAVITLLTQACQAERAEFRQRDLSGCDYVYLFVDGVHL
jgi:hypothetical protein